MSGQIIGQFTAEEIAQEQRKVQTIEIDCRPMTPRPDSYIEGVIEDTGLPLRDPVAKCFGNWTWDYSDVSPEEWKKAQELTAPRIKRLYDEGYIRYGSW